MQRQTTIETENYLICCFASVNDYSQAGWPVNTFFSTPDFASIIQ